MARKVSEDRDRPLDGEVGAHRPVDQRPDPVAHADPVGQDRRRGIGRDGHPDRDAVTERRRVEVVDQTTRSEMPFGAATSACNSSRAPLPDPADGHVTVTSTSEPAATGGRGVTAMDASPVCHASYSEPSASPAAPDRR